MGEILNEPRTPPQVTQVAFADTYYCSSSHYPPAPKSLKHMNTVSHSTHTAAYSNWRHGKKEKEKYWFVNTHLHLAQNEHLQYQSSWDLLHHELETLLALQKHDILTAMLHHGLVFSRDEGWKWFNFTDFYTLGSVKKSGAVWYS